eukprot:2212844-Rhodomonas_salina.1
MSGPKQPRTTLSAHYCAWCIEYTHTHAHTRTQTHTDTDADTDADAHTHRDIDRHRHTDTQTHYTVLRRSRCSPRYASTAQPKHCEINSTNSTVSAQRVPELSVHLVAHVAMNFGSKRDLAAAQAYQHQTRAKGLGSRVEGLESGV